MWKAVLFLGLNLALASTLRIPRGKKDGRKDPAKLTLERDPREDLLLDDIRQAPVIQKSGISDSRFLWSSPIPYAFDPEIPLNTKAVIVRSLQDFMLKSCITFKPREDEDSYLYFQQLEGCWSYIGQIFGKQTISIGEGCEQPYIVKHEILHALGFLHEQSREDRDEYVTINFNNIIEGTESNFQKVRAGVTTSNGVPYDYFSVMHYSPFGFSKNFLPTITTKNPEFQNDIGMYTEMSPADVLELNLLYQCPHPVANSIHCTFEPEFPCKMRVCPHSQLEWTLEDKVENGPQGDHTSLPNRLPGNNAPPPQPGTFGHVSTAYSREGESGWVATPVMTPTLGCRIQCLQFFYYHSGSDADIMNIWLREYKDYKDHKGTRRLVGQVTGPATEFWKIHHVPLNAVRRFRVEFQVRKGNGISVGGISIDDINISETKCPAVAIHVDNFLNMSHVDSEVVYSTSGYGFIGGVDITDELFRPFIALASGKNDAKLQWPVENHRVIFTLLDRNPRYQDRMSFINESPVDPEAEVNGDLIWGNPRENTDRVIKSKDDESILLGHEYSTSAFLMLLDRLHLYKGGSVVLFMDLEELSPYKDISSLACPQLEPFEGQHAGKYRKEEDCFTKILPVTKAPPPEPTQDKSVFGFCPAVVASPALILWAMLTLLMP